MPNIISIFCFLCLSKQSSKSEAHYAFSLYIIDGSERLAPHPTRGSAMLWWQEIHLTW
jgi:hypothetical protein